MSITVSITVSITGPITGPIVERSPSRSPRRSRGDHTPIMWHRISRDARPVINSGIPPDPAA
ncbi:hypothetical protein ACTVZO_23560 [Streptomyces sp. IBSNAI002]|uniref:hypothetical protein n=1 Tax=Streptomyces sp. IBSNAI002 TaxID=3457500 RepID=UPI003FD3362E